MDAFVRSVMAGQRPETVALKASEFLTPSVSYGTGAKRVISREMLVGHYAATEREMPDTRDLIATGAPFLFVVNQIRSKDVKPLEIAPRAEFASKAPGGGTEFVVYLFGSTEDARAITVRVRGFRPFFDLEIASVDEFRPIFERLDKASKSPLSWTIRQAQTMRFGQPRLVARISAASYHAARAAYKTLEREGRMTYNNRFRGYFPKDYYRDFLIETNLTLGAWFEARGATAYKYNLIPAATYGGAILHVDVDWSDLKNDGVLFRDPSLVLAWDIETYSHAHHDLPEYANPHDELSLICCDFFWHFSTAAIFSVSLSLRECDAARYQERYPQKPMIIVVCSSQAELLRCFSLLFKRFQPSFTMDFNGTHYDWPWVVHRAAVQADLAIEGSQRRVSSLERFYENMSYSECACLYEKFDDTTPREHILRTFTDIMATKLAAGKDSKCYYLNVDGFLPLDLYVVNIKSDPNAEITTKNSLSYFASTVLKIADKVELAHESPDPDIRERLDHYAELRRIVTEYDAAGSNSRMRDYIYYCGVDAEICQRMAHKLNVIAGLRAWANETRLSLHDIAWKAGSLRVTNALMYNGRHAFERVHGVPMIYDLVQGGTEASDDVDTTPAKIEGAYVASPLYGHQLLSPVFGLDINSLYPNMMILYNLCHSRIILYEHVVDGKRKPDYMRMWADVARVGYANVNEIPFTYDGEQYYFFTIKHRGEQKLMGNAPLMLQSIFARRIVKKEGAGRLGAFVKDLGDALTTPSRLGGVLSKWRGICGETYIDPASGKKIKIKSSEIRSEIEAYLANIAGAGDTCEAVNGLYDSIDFSARLASADEQAMKLLMNTTYGVLAARITALFSIYLSSAVTAMGQRTIKMLQAEAQRRGFIRDYGDTDSMYLHRPLSYWQKQLDELMQREAEIRGSVCDETTTAAMLEALRGARRAYYAAVIPLAISDSLKLNDELNDFLAAAHEGQRTVTLAAEGVKAPAQFFSKKVYAGLKHDDKAELLGEKRLINIAFGTPPRSHGADADAFCKVVLVKGLDMVKQGFAQITIDATIRMLCKLMDPLSDSNLLWQSPVRVVEDEISWVIQNEEWDNYDRFVQTRTFRANKQNVTVHEFVERLRARSDPRTPADGDKFLYVVTLPDIPSHDIFGRRNVMRLSRKWELLEVAREQGLKIDRRYYIEHQLLNTLRKMTKYLFDTEELRARGLGETQHADALTRAADRYIGDILATHLQENTEAYHDVRRYTLSVRDSVVPSIRRCIESMYSNVDHGHIRVRDDAPRVLARGTAEGILQRMFVSDVDPFIPLEPASDLAQIDLARLDAILPPVLHAYSALERVIEEARRRGAASGNISFATIDFSIINEYLDFFEQARARNLASASRMAAKSRAAFERQHDE